MGETFCPKVTQLLPAKWETPGLGGEICATEPGSHGLGGQPMGICMALQR